MISLNVKQILGLMCGFEPLMKDNRYLRGRPVSKSVLLEKMLRESAVSFLICILIVYIDIKLVMMLLMLLIDWLESEVGRLPL
jgi:hypothetical protein